MGVAVRRYIDIFIIISTFPYSTCISSFFGSFFVHFKNVFSFFYTSSSHMVNSSSLSASGWQYRWNRRQGCMKATHMKLAQGHMCLH